MAATDSVNVDLSTSVSAADLIILAGCPLTPPFPMGPGPEEYSYGETTFTTGDNGGLPTRHVFEVTGLGAMEDPEILLYAGASGFNPAAPASNFLGCELGGGLTSPVFPRLVSTLAPNSAFTVVVIVPKGAPSGSLSATLGLGREPSINFADREVQLGATGQFMTATSDSDGPLTYLSQFPSIAGIDPLTGELTPLAAGTTQVAAFQQAQDGSGPFGSGVQEASLTVTEATPAPSVASVSPSFGPPAGGTRITITGSNLTGVSAVEVGGAAATDVEFVSDASIFATTPAGTLGARDVVVTTPAGSGTGVGLFTYTDLTAVTEVTISSDSNIAGSPTIITVVFRPTSSLAAGDTVEVGLSGYTLEEGTVGVLPVAGFSMGAALSGSVGAGDLSRLTVTLESGALNAATAATLIFSATNPPVAGTIARAGLTVATSQDTQPVASSADIVLMPPSEPGVTDPTSSDVRATRATLGGNVLSDGGREIIERGVVLAPNSQNSNPEIGGTGVSKLVGTGELGLFTVQAEGLEPGTEYAYRAYATNAAGLTGYSAAATVATPSPLSFLSQPTLSSRTSSSITVTFRMSGTTEQVRAAALTVGQTATAAEILADSAAGRQGTPSPAAAATAMDQTLTVSGLAAETAYDIYVATEVGAISDKLTVATRPASPPLGITLLDGTANTYEDVYPARLIRDGTAARFDTPRLRFNVSGPVESIRFVESSDPSLVDAVRVSPLASAGPTVVYFAPEPDANGEVDLSFVAVGADNNESDPVVVSVTVRPLNDVPTALFNNPRTTDPRSYAFVLSASEAASTVNLSALIESVSPGPADEAGQTVTARVLARSYPPSWVTDPACAASIPTITLNGSVGDLSWTPPAGFATCRYGMELYDSGPGSPPPPGFSSTECLPNSPHGNCNRYLVSFVRLPDAEVQALYALLLNARPQGQGAPTKAFERSGAKGVADELLTFEISNLGNIPAEGARLQVTLPQGLSGATWTCSSLSGGCTPASGTGAVDTLIDVDVAERVEIVYSGEYTGALFFSAFYTLTPPAGLSPDTQIISEITPQELSVPATSSGIFRGSFDGEPNY